MTRLARRTSLLVAFYLLTSAATAHAECAWVFVECIRRRFAPCQRMGCEVAALK